MSAASTAALSLLNQAASLRDAGDPAARGLEDQARAVLGAEASQAGVGPTPKLIRLIVSPDSGLPIIEFDGYVYALKGLEAMGVVKLSTMDRMILGDLTRKLQAIAVALENRG
jgi:hypothetical protein